MKSISFLFAILIAILFIGCAKQFQNPFDENCFDNSWKPSELDFFILSQNEVRLAWKQDEQHIEGFKIDKKAGATWVNEYAVIDKSRNSWIDTDFNAEEQNSFYYRVYAYAANNISEKITINTLVTVQKRLNDGETPFELYKTGIPLDSLYGKTFQEGLICFLDIYLGNGIVSASNDQSSASTFDNALQLCDDLNTGVFNNWYLPSKTELTYMYNNLKQRRFGNFVNDFYWSNNIQQGGWDGTITASQFNFKNGFYGEYYLTSVNARVRAVHIYN